MLHSMTGYGRGEAGEEGLAVAVEIKTVNHRYSDISVKLPRLFLALENEIRRRVSDSLKRGKIDIFVTQETAGTTTLEPSVNLPLARSYQRAFEELRATLGLGGDIPLSLVAGQRDVIGLVETRLGEEAVRKVLAAALAQALEAVERMRRAEGEALARDIAGHLDALEDLRRGIGERAPRVVDEWRGRLLERIERLRGEVECDPQRLAQEVLLFADRCDISEELARFDSHIQQFRALFADPEPVGRRMDFLLQELNREANTMGSKANDAELARLVVELKAGLERIREQVQNIE